MISLELAELKRPIQTMPEHSICGDATFIEETPSYTFLALFDGAGHGYSAYKAAEIAMHFLQQCHTTDLTADLLSLHEVLKGTVGGVAGLCHIEKKTAILTCTGIGNVRIRLFTPDSMDFLIRGGVLGQEISPPKLIQTPLKRGNILMLYSDGVDRVFEINQFPNFFELSAQDIARITIDYHSKILDDASVIVGKVCDD